MYYIIIIIMFISIISKIFNILINVIELMYFLLLSHNDFMCKLGVHDRNLFIYLSCIHIIIIILEILNF